MIASAVDLLRAYPQIVIFLCLALGYAIGKIKVKGFSLGATTGCLLAGLVVGQIGIDIPDLLKTIAFALFIFGVGYRVGPAILSGLKIEGLNYLWVSLVVGVAGLGTALALGVVLGLNPGTTAGLLSGAMTQSATIGTAEGAIKQLSISAAEASTYQSDLAVAYAITYIFGTAGLILTLKLMPRILGIDLRAEAKALRSRMAGGAEAEPPDLLSWHKQLDLRAFEAEAGKAVGKTVAELESTFAGKVEVDRIRRNGKRIKAGPATVIQENDILAIIGLGRDLVEAAHPVGQEVPLGAFEKIKGEIANIVLMKKQAVGKTLQEISNRFGRGIFLRGIVRQGHEILLTGSTVVHPYDTLRVAGERNQVEQAVRALGFAERPTTTTDLIMLGTGIVLGTLIGLLSVKVFEIPITLGVGGGVLVSGLFFGWLRAMHPTFGQIPAPALWVFTDLGLNLFIVCVGLVAGVKAVSAIEETGLVLLLAGVAVTLTPMLARLFVGRYVLKMNAALLFGALTGAGTCTAALNVIKERVASAAPVIGYTAPYAIGNVLLTVWGAVIVNVMHHIQ